MNLNDYKPQSRLVVKQTEITRPKFPVIDAHNHLAEPFGGGWDNKPISQLLDQLDQAGITHYVDLDGGWGEDLLNKHLDVIKAHAPERFSVFGGIDWPKWAEMGNAFPEYAAKRLRIQKERGADGLKVWKGFGLNVRDQKGDLARVNDPRLDPIWETCAELHLPVVIHIADPVAFFDPIDETNERWEELGNHPDWAFTSPPYPPFISILEDFADMVARHPHTTYIGAHVGCYAENLGWVGDLLDRCPNFNVDMAARIGELGRQPYTARRFFMQYADRILFGLDLGPDVPSYLINYRFLETDDEYFNYNTGPIPLQGRWFIHGLYLPDDVLQKVYSKNAERLILKRQQSAGSGQ
jgi:predicted TIM-barrel fold metal-dependent hydrolase